MRRKQIIRRIWHIYVEACVCSMDYHTTCDCPAADMAGRLLTDLLGSDWHAKCREMFDE